MLYSHQNSWEEEFKMTYAFIWTAIVFTFIGIAIGVIIEAGRNGKWA
jgi:heme exporter protein D